MKTDSALNGLLEQIAADRAAPDDYINPDDGLRYCGKCHTPKEAFFDEQHRQRGFEKHPVLCRCAREEQEKQEAAEKEFRRQSFMRNLRNEAFADIPAYTWRFENATEQTKQLMQVKTYSEKWDEFFRDNIGLTLFGKVGTGKSYAAGCVANALLDRGIFVRFICLADAINRMQGCMGDERERYTKSLMRPDLLILDDLGAERNTSYGKERVFDFVNRRLLYGKPMIVTSNITLDAMKNTTDVDYQRIYGRILEVTLPINFCGKNLRDIKAAANTCKAINTLCAAEAYSDMERM